MIIRVDNPDRFALLRSIFTPHGAHCYGCGTAMASFPQLGESPFLCPDCMKRIKPLSYPVCKRCGAPMPVMHDSEFCGNCNFDNVAIDCIRGAVLWNTLSKKLVYGLKTDAARHTTATMAWFMKRELNSYNINFDVITSVPTYKPPNKKGHATFLALELAKQLKIEFSYGSLVKVKGSEDYAGNAFEGRQKLAANNFTVLDYRDFFDKKVLIIDDVVTTGNTLNACASLLKKAGAIYVFGMGFARVAYKLKK